MKFTLQDLQALYPTNDDCLEEIWHRRYPDPTCPKCERVNKYYKIKNRPLYSCICGHQISPLAGSIFENTTTPLTTWFYVAYVMSQTKSGVSAAYISRVTGVTYKTAWRMMHKIRELMVDDEMLEGDVEADETFLKAKSYRNSRAQQGATGYANAEVLFGVTERGGRVRVKHVEAASSPILREAVKQTVKKGSHIHTDGARHYLTLPRDGYEHSSYIHYFKPFVAGEFSFNLTPGPSTQYIEGFWSQLKPAMRGVYRSVSPRYLESYANEYAFRYSNRFSDVPLFELLLEKV